MDFVVVCNKRKLRTSLPGMSNFIANHWFCLPLGPTSLIYIVPHPVSHIWLLVLTLFCQFASTSCAIESSKKRWIPPWFGNVDYNCGILLLWLEKASAEFYVAFCKVHEAWRIQSGGVSGLNTRPLTRSVSDASTRTRKELLDIPPLFRVHHGVHSVHVCCASAELTIMQNLANFCNEFLCCLSYLINPLLYHLWKFANTYQDWVLLCVLYSMSWFMVNVN